MKSIKYVLNGKGEMEPVEVSANSLPRSIRNAVGDISDSSLGYQIVTDTLTYIKKQVTTQKFYEVDFASYVPLAVGEGSFAQNLLTNLEFNSAGDFESGVINTGQDNDRLATATAGVTAKTVKIANWAKGISYSIFEIEQALFANNWDAIAAKERARKKNWDLGLQDMTFLGSKTNQTEFPGLLSGAGINVNTTLIQQPISTMDATTFNSFIATLISTYFDNTNKTATPDVFIIPQSDFFGLQTLTPGTVGTYPVPKIKYLEDAFKAATMNPNFKILPSAYAESSVNAAWGIDKQIYQLYRMDPESVRMDVPLQYTVTQPNSKNNFQFESVAYGQFTGVHFYRNLEGLQFTYSGS